MLNFNVFETPWRQFLMSACSKGAYVKCQQVLEHGKVRFQRVPKVVGILGFHVFLRWYKD